MESPQKVFAAISEQINDGDYQSAGEASKKAWLKAPDSEWGWQFKLQYALTLLYIDDTRAAQALLKPDLPRQFPALQPRYQYVKAYLLIYLHDTRAKGALKAAIASAEAQSDPVTEADGLITLSVIETKEGLRGALATQALEVARRNHLKYQEAISLHRLGRVALVEKRFGDAIPYFSQVISLSKKIHVRYLAASSLSDLGDCYFNLGNLDLALESFADARTLLRPDDHSELPVDVNRQLGVLYSLRKQDGEALRYYRAAFAIAQPIGGVSKRYISSAINLSQGLIQTNVLSSLDEAEKFNELAGGALEKALKLTRPPTKELVALLAENELNRADIAAARDQPQNAETLYQKVLSVLSKEPASSTKWSAYARLAEVEAQCGERAAARNNFENALRTIEANRTQQKVADYQITFLSALIRFYQQYVEFLVRQKQPWQALAVADSSRASVLTQGLKSSREQPGFAALVSNAAREGNCVFLFYWLAPDASYLWAVTPRGNEFKQLTAAASNIENDVRAYSAAITSAHQDTLALRNPAGMRLYETLIGPVASHLKPDMRVIVVPDGALHGLNFETLLVKDKKPHYWLEDVSLTVAPSLGILLGRSRSASSSGKALIIGDPIYSGTKYPPLPESRKEVAEVSARFPDGSTVLTQSQAVPEAYEKARPELFSLVHFSAHVVADPLSPLDSAIILSTGANGSRLYARDVMNSHLNADLVTVSGCSSVGAKELSGEGMVGFAWAAFDAGARNAVTSLWAVDDRSATELMDGFYQGVTAGQPYWTALREAKRQMLKSLFKKPYYWAPFQLYSRDLGLGKGSSPQHQPAP